MPTREKTSVPRRLLATAVAVTVVTLSTALAAFSSGGPAFQGNIANVADEPRPVANSNTATGGGSDSGAIGTGQQSKELTQQLESAADIVIQFDNSSDAPLIINAASIKAVKAPLDPGVPPNRYRVSPDVQLQSTANKRVTGLVLSFTCGCGKGDKTCSGEGGLDLAPGSEYRFKMKPQWDVFTLDGDPNRLRVSVAAVLLEGEDLWVNINETGVRLQGTLAVRSDSNLSDPSSPTKSTSSRPGGGVQSEPRASADSAKAGSDAACVGHGCAASLIKMLSEHIGLPVVFEGSVEGRLQTAGAFYLRNFRYEHLIEIILRLNNLKYSRTGDQLNVKNDDSPESLQRLNLSN